MNAITHPQTMTLPPRFTSAFVHPNKVTLCEDFSFRRNGINKAHVRTLAQAMRAMGGKLDPITLWREETPEGEPTGRLLLIDGAHRLAAFRATRGVICEGNRGLPATIISCTRAEAALQAAAANSKETLPLTLNERTDAAWRLVREYGYALSGSQIAKATGVSLRTVASMRSRLKEMTEAGIAITGQWHRDREGATPDQEDMTEAERKREIAKLAEDLRKAFGQWPRRDVELCADALQEALGNRLKFCAEYLYSTGEDDFYGMPIGSITGAAVGEPEGDF